MKRSFARLSLLTCLLSLLPFSAHAYLEIGESGEILADGEYQFGFMPQLLLSDGNGANVDAFVDTPYNDSMSFRAAAGAGTVDFHVGGGVKYVPFPDVGQQPAIGAKASAWFARDADMNILTVQLAPLVSRKVETQKGWIVPYIAIPVNITSTKDRNFTGTQVVVGSDWRNPDWPDLLVGAELAIKMNDSYSSLSAWVSFPFDGRKGFRHRK